MALFIEPTLEQVRSQVTEDQERKIRDRLIRQALPRYVETKAMYQEFLRDTMGNVALKDRKETRQKINSKASRLFYERQVPEELKRHKVNDLVSLDEKLRKKSSSLAVLKNQFIEHVMAREFERSNVPQKYDIPRDELWLYYQEHLSDWQRPATARWRQLTARFDKQPDRHACQQLINDMFNEVYLGGKPFEAVAKQRSQGYTAASGGVYDWTTKASLKSRALDDAIFSYPIGKLSPVIEDEIGLHVIEVLKRKESHTVTFEDAQTEINKILSDKRREEGVRHLREQVIKRALVWTRWPEDIPGSKSLSEALGEQPQ